MSLNTQTRRTVLSAFIAVLPVSAFAQGNLFDQGRNLLPGAGGAAQGGGAGANLPSGEIGAGLKDALKVASQRTVGQVGKPGGFSDDPSIRIPLPGPLEKIKGPLKMAGAGGMLDDLQLRMNRAAEEAAPKALDIFTDAISKMTIDDARGILTGPKDAATQYFKRTTTPELTTAFHPIVEHTLSGAGALSVFKSVQAKAASVPFAGQEVQSFNLTDYTVGKGLDGLFHYLAVQEESIRTNPAARTTDLLRKVFG